MSMASVDRPDPGMAVGDIGDLASSTRPGEDARGALRYIDASTVLNAVQLVETGEVIALSHPLDYPAVPPGGRPRLIREMLQANELRALGDGAYLVANDDKVTIALQGSSHWDALAHCGVIDSKRPGVFYGGRGLDETRDGRAASLGIDAVAGSIVTRGVLLDIVSLDGASRNGYLREDVRISEMMIRRCLDAQGTVLQAGDAVCIYTGFEARLRELGESPLPANIAGLGGDTMPLWEHARVAALISDNNAVEACPVDYSVHIGALRDYGILLGELWALEKLASRCRARGVYEFLLVSAPLVIPGAFGSPANAVAVM